MTHFTPFLFTLVFLNSLWRFRIITSSQKLSYGRRQNGHIDGQKFTERLVFISTCRRPGTNTVLCVFFKMRTIFLLFANKPIKLKSKSKDWNSVLQVLKMKTIFLLFAYKPIELKHKVKLKFCFTSLINILVPCFLRNTFVKWHTCRYVRKVQKLFRDLLGKKKTYMFLYYFNSNRELNLKATVNG